MSDQFDLTPETIASADEHVRAVAALIPFPIELEAEMGGTSVLQIDLGSRDPSRDGHPHDRAGIEPTEPGNDRWWLDVEGGRKTHISHLGFDAAPADVAAWITTTARAEHCPAAIDTARTEAIVRASFPAAPGADVAAPASARVWNASGDRHVGRER